MNSELIDRYKNFLGKEYKQLISCRTDQFPEVIRIDDSRVDKNIIIRTLKKKNINLKKIPYLKSGFETRSKINLTSTPEYLAGLIYLQSASSQIPVEVLDPKPGENILDMAASPGSKLTQIAQYSRNKAIIIATELQQDRLKILHNNIERMKCENIITYNINSLKFEPNFKFDKILLDAPCSGNLCLEKNWLEKRTLKDIREKSEYQKKLFEKAFSLLKQHGILVYSTCSIEPEENEDIIEWALQRFNLRLENISINLKNTKKTITKNQEIKNNCIRLWPHLHNTDAFFVAKLRK